MLRWRSLALRICRVIHLITIGLLGHPPHYIWIIKLYTSLQLDYVKLRDVYKSLFENGQRARFPKS